VETAVRVESSRRLRIKQAHGAFRKSVTLNRQSGLIGLVLKRSADQRDLIDLFRDAIRLNSVLFAFCNKKIHATSLIEICAYNFCISGPIIPAPFGPLPYYGLL